MFHWGTQSRTVKGLNTGRHDHVWQWKKQPQRWACRLLRLLVISGHLSQLSGGSNRMELKWPQAGFGVELEWNWAQEKNTNASTRTPTPWWTSGVAPCFILNSIHLNAIIRIIAVALLTCIFWPRVSTLSDAPSTHRSGKAVLSLVWSWTSAHFSSRTRALVSLQYSGFFLRFHHCLPVSPQYFYFLSLLLICSSTAHYIAFIGF